VPSAQRRRLVLVDSYLLSPFARTSPSMRREDRQVTGRHPLFTRSRLVRMLRALPLQGRADLGAKSLGWGITRQDRQSRFELCQSVEGLAVRDKCSR